MDIIFDIDGTLTDPSHRRHLIACKPKRWDEFYALAGDDKPKWQVINLAQKLKAAGDSIILCSGRPERLRPVTGSWMLHHGVPYDLLYMRAEGDHRPDTIVKREMLDQMRAGKIKPTVAFDDRNSVVAMWREAGLVCAQVAEGDF